MYQYLIVAGVSASPVGELLVSIPIGFSLKLSPPLVALIAVVFNFLPALAIALVFSRAERSRGPLRWLTHFRRERVARVVGRFGLPGVVIAIPWLGVWAVTVTLEAVGVLGTVLVSLLLHAALLLAGFELIFG